MANFVLLCALILFLLAGIAFMFCGFLYLTCGKCRRLYHDILGWHQPDDKETFISWGGFLHSKCKWCGKDIEEDSQGNWF